MEKENKIIVDGSEEIREVIDKDKIIKLLQRRGRRKGYLNQEEITYYLKSKILQFDDLGELFEFFNNKNIQIVNPGEISESDVKKEKKAKSLGNGSGTKRAALEEYSKEPNFINVYLNEIGRIPLLSNDEINVLSRNYRDTHDEDARAMLIRSNLRLVVNVARHYQNSKMDFLDLIEEGNIGLIKAVEKYDPEKGYHFSTYAIWWIKQAIIRGMANQSRLIKLPVYILNAVKKITSLKREYQIKNNETISIDDLCRKMNMSRSQVAVLSTFTDNIISLDSNFFQDSSGAKLYDIITDENESHFSDKIDEDQMRAVLLKYIQKLSQKEANVILLRYGFIGGERYTLDEAGTVMNLTRERVRQLEKKALKRLNKFLEKEEFF